MEPNWNVVSPHFMVTVGRALNLKMKNYEERNYHK